MYSIVVFTFLIILLFNYNCVTAQESPCPGIFQYQKDEFGVFYGVLKILPPRNAENIQVDVQLSSGNPTSTGKISLDMGMQEALASALSGKPLRYKITFPQGNNTPPHITKVVVNNNHMCSGPPVKNTRYTVTINLTNTIKIIQSEVNIQPFVPEEIEPFEPEPEPVNPPYDPKNDLPFEILLPYETTPSTTSTTISRIPATTPQFNSNSNFGSDPICGTHKEQHSVNLIAFGQIAVKDKYPWLGALFRVLNRKPEFTCGASLVSNKHLITAAHCLQNVRVDKLVVLLGSDDIVNPFAGGIFFGVESFKNNEEYYGTTGDADISIIRLRESVTFSDHIRPVCIWPEEKSVNDITNMKGSVAGWGRTEEGKISDKIREIELPIVSNQDCLQSNTNFKQITSDRTFCAGLRNLSGPCVGDSGSGFYLKNSDGRLYIRGIVSVALKGSGNEVCDLQNYVVFADVARYSNWITHNLI